MSDKENERIETTNKILSFELQSLFAYSKKSPLFQHSNELERKNLPFFLGRKLFSHQNSTIVILEKFIHLKTKIEPRRKRAYTKCVNHYFGFLVFIVSFFIIELCERGVCKCVLIRVRCTYAHFITNKSRENRGYMAHDHGHNSVFMISNSNRKD